MAPSWKIATLVSLLILAVLAAAQNLPEAHVAQGDLVGIRDHGANAFLNIPFAAPPLGDLRWTPPSPPLSWTGARDAGHFGPACMQYKSGPYQAWTSEFY